MIEGLKPRLVELHGASARRPRNNVVPPYVDFGLLAPAPHARSGGPTNELLLAFLVGPVSWSNADDDAGSDVRRS